MVENSFSSPISLGSLEKYPHLPQKVSPVVKDSGPSSQQRSKLLEDMIAPTQKNRGLAYLPIPLQKEAGKRDQFFPVMEYEKGKTITVDSQALEDLRLKLEKITSAETADFFKGVAESKNEDYLRTVKLLAAQLRDSFYRQRGGRASAAWEAMPQPERMSVRALEMMMLLAEARAVELRLDAGTMKPDIAASMYDHFSGYLENEDIASTLKNILSTINERLDEQYERKLSGERDSRLLERKLQKKQMQEERQERKKRETARRAVLPRALSQAEAAAAEALQDVGPHAEMISAQHVLTERSRPAKRDPEHVLAGAPAAETVAMGRSDQETHVEVGSPIETLVDLFCRDWDSVRTADYRDNRRWQEALPLEMRRMAREAGAPDVWTEHWNGVLLAFIKREDKVLWRDLQSDTLASRYLTDYLDEEFAGNYDEARPQLIGFPQDTIRMGGLSNAPTKVSAWLADKSSLLRVRRGPKWLQWGLGLMAQSLQLGFGKTADLLEPLFLSSRQLRELYASRRFELAKALWEAADRIENKEEYVQVGRFTVEAGEKRKSVALLRYVAARLARNALRDSFSALGS